MTGMFLVHRDRSRPGGLLGMVVPLLAGLLAGVALLVIGLAVAQGCVW